MGDVKNNMTPSKDTNTKKEDGGLLGRLTSRRRQRETEPKRARNFADAIQEADTILSTLIATKEAELKSEKGREDYNSKALARLRTIGYHLDEICNQADEYAQL